MSRSVKEFFTQINISMKTKKRRLLVKVGTRILFDEKGIIKRGAFHSIGCQIKVLLEKDFEVLLVTSGAIATARHVLGQKGRESKDLNKQHLAAIGSPHLLSLWREALMDTGREIGQFWVTYEDLFDSQKRKPKKVLEIIRTCSDQGDIPVINENDVVSDLEIRSMERGISDNDWLASIVALFTDVSDVIFLSEAGGIFEGNPTVLENARLYREIDAYNKPLSLRGRVSPGGMGRGGVGSKLDSAIRCFKRGMRVSVAGLRDGVLADFVEGRPVGTSIGKQNVLKE
jgi:glutamate 5-kinase